jgi:hypothetical protein
LKGTRVLDSFLIIVRVKGISGSCAGRSYLGSSSLKAAAQSTSSSLQV